MCGRVCVTTTLEGLLAAFGFNSLDGVEEGDDPLNGKLPRWNGAPGQYYPIFIRQDDEETGVIGRRAVMAQWGLMPAWFDPSKSKNPPPINARCETIKSQPMFRSAYKSRRCLMPIHGYFEWHDIYGTKKNKQPYAIGLKSGEPFCLAGIWEVWRDRETGLERRTFAVVTCGPNEMMAEIHDRMPVILHREDYARWLSAEPDPEDLMVPYPSELMTKWPIGRKVGNVANNTPDILDPEDPQAAPPPKPPKGPKSGPDDDQPSLF